MNHIIIENKKKERTKISRYTLVKMKGSMVVVNVLRFVFALLMMSSCMASDNNVPVQLNDDVLGLVVFKSDLIDPSSYLASWNEEDNTPCSWRFIQCDPVTSRVSQVSLEGLGLSGKLGRGLERLQQLKVLSLAQNNFTGEISPLLTLAPTLEHLNLSQNQFSGRIPVSLVSFRSMKFLDLSENSFSGPVPDDWLKNCSSLRVLSLGGNMLEGPIPSTLYTCTSLNSLNLSSNQLSGPADFGSGFWKLQRLRVLDLSNNVLSGSVPKGVSVIHNLKLLLLQGNQLSGLLPPDIGLCPHLTTLDVSKNSFTGSIPETTRWLKSLAFLSLGKNKLSGEFPQWIGETTSLEYMDFSSNRLTGTLPPSIGSLTSLRCMDLSTNEISGEIPRSLVYCSKLTSISLRSNSFTGNMPEGLFNLSLEELDLSRNSLVGSIPQGSSKLLQSLRMMDLSRNNFTGEIPAEMGLFSNLVYLNLSWNNLQSRMPPEIGYFQNLTVLDLRNNQIQGPIPGDICYSGSLDILQLDGNLLDGPIPEEIGNCSSLYLLSLSHNNLTGPIPESMSVLNKLKILKLEFNRLSGEIPQDLGKLENLLAVNISYNVLTGRLPVGGIFPSLDQSALQGNLGICSPLLQGPCKMNVPKPLVLDPYAYGNQMGGHKERNGPSNSSLHHRMFLSVSAIIAISAAILIACGVILITLLNVSARRRLAFVEAALESICSSSSRSGSFNTGKLILFDSKASPDIISSPHSLLNKASEIGEGVFGTVYKVPLGVQGRMVAVKRLLTSNIIQYPEDFNREVRVLGKVRHPNLISLKGYYCTPQLQLLVTEYATNGSLQSKLHERLPSTPPLPWAARFKIVLGTAKGLTHLHHSFRPPIIHYNIKPSNILLDENNNPKISDFGLARLVTKLDRHVMSNRFQSAPGYAAPELACQSLRVNEKCDVYGFGIMILEIITGRRPIEYGEDSVMILSDHVRVLLEQGNVLDCVDPSMDEYPEDEVLPVLKLALVCTSQIPSSRPTMAEVVQILQVIKTPVPQHIEPY